MDYSENDNEGSNNFHFDSLVDNEVFLGIPSQDDDNQWIEDYSRGTSGLRFDSSATVSCTLPRCNNVWSEVTSSESVEMLLKAVGQEELVPGESTVNEMEVVNQVDSTKKLETSLRQDDEVNDVDGVNLLLPAAEVEPKFFMSDQSINEEKDLSSCGVSADDKDNSSTLISDVITTSEDKGEINDPVNDSLNEQVQESLPLSSIGIDKVGSSYEEHAAILGNGDKTSDIGFISLTCKPNEFAERVGEHKENTAETVNSDVQHSFFPPVIESSNEVHVIEAQVENFGSTAEVVGEHKDNSVQTVNSDEIQHSLFTPVIETLNEAHFLEVQVDTTSMSKREESVSEVENRGEVAFDAELSIGSERGSEIKQIYEGYSMSHGMSSVSFQQERCKDGHDAKEGDDITKVCDDIEPKQDSVTQLSDRPLIHDGVKDVFPDSISIEVPLATFESSSPSEQNIKNNIDNANGPEKSGIECVKEAMYATAQNESIDDGCHNHPGMDGNKLASGEDSSSKQKDDDLSSPALAQEHDVSLTACEKDDKNLPLGASKVVSDDHENEVEAVEVNVEGATGPQPGASVGNYQGLQTEVNKKGSLEVDVDNVNNVLLTPTSSRVNLLATHEETFTFDIRPSGDHSTEDFNRSTEQISTIQTSLIGKGFPSTSSSSQKDAGTLGTSLDSSCMPALSVSVKGSSDRKPRRRSSKSGKESAKKANLAKETTPLQQSARLDKSPTFSSGQFMTFGGFVKTVGGVSVSSTFSLPDLSNTSVPSSALFRQPFTDLQQKQLRAQIIVYGSIINGETPEEACMVSAFDGGRSLWEPSWRACIERRYGKKNDTYKAEAERPSQSRSGATATDQSNVPGSSQTSVFLTPLGRASDRAAPSTLSPFVKPIIPLSPPLWNISTPSCAGLPSHAMPRFDYRAVSPLHTYPTTQAQNLTAKTTNLPEQTPFPAPWLASSKNSPFELRASFTPSPITEPVKLTPLKELPHVPAIHTAATTVFTGTPLDLKKVTGSTSKTETKARKRKKSSAATALPIHVTASQVDIVSTPLVTSSHLTANFSASPVTVPVKLTPPNELPHVSEIHNVATTMFNGTPPDLGKVTGSTSKTETKTRKRRKPSVTAALPIHLTASQMDAVSTTLVAGHLPVKIPVMEKLSEISFTKNQTAEGLESAISLYSTPVTVPTASFFPEIASNEVFPSAVPTVSTDPQTTALRLDKRALDMESINKVEEAKLQAEEAAAIATETVNQCQGVWSKLDQQKNLGLTIDAEAKLASASVAIAAAASVAKAAAAAAKIAFNAAVQAKQMADEAISTHGAISSTSLSDFRNMTPVSTLAISAAREAARKRIEAASAASRHAEHLDAILKAAELAAEAVSHTGKIVGIGDPFSLSKLVQAGPDDYWKDSHLTSAPGSVPEDMNLHEQPDKDARDTCHVAAIQTDVSEDFGNDNTTAEVNFISSDKGGDKSLKPQKSKRDGIEAVSTISVSDIELRSSSSVPYDSNACIKEGSVVEVLKDVGGVKKAWFAATVSSLQDDKALVCYTELREGSEKVEEWVSLEAQGDHAPLVRIARPKNDSVEGTRKRRRPAVKDYAWSVGDSVDAFVKDCWREGTIAEKSNKDPSTMAVNFPADGEILNVKMWDLRPSLVWSDGQWSEHCKPGHCGTSQGDTPKEKRPRLGNAGMESEGNGKMTRKIGFAKQGTTNEEKLPFSANEIAFNIGTREENKVRTMRSGLQKEGPRVVFGVPTPKKKFMEVSKHYVSERPTKTNSNDLAKSAKYATPLGFGSRGSKNNSRPGLKEKHVPEPRAVKSRKPPIPTRPTLQQKDDTTLSQLKVKSSDRLGKCSSLSNDDNDSDQQNVSESGSFSDAEETSRGTSAFSSKALSTERRKKAESRNIQSERLNKGKVPISSGKLAKTVSDEQLTSEASEPRRSNRRIQPTSRLLEGLQSSLTISKLPSSHDKGLRSHKGTPKSSGNDDN